MSTLRELARQITSTSRLEVGRQFTTDELCEMQATSNIKLVDVDFVEYDRKDRKPQDSDYHVSYSVWTVNVIDKDSGEVQTGFYRGGTTLNDLATDIIGGGLVDDLRAEGLFIALKVKKTSKGQNFTQVTVM